MVTDRGRGNLGALDPDGIVLVTGGAGFVGSHVVDRLVQLGWPVRVLDTLDPSVHPTPPDDLNARAELLRGDVRDAADVDRALEGVVAVSHHAAKVGLGRDFEDAPAYVSANDQGTATLLSALHRRGFRGRFVRARRACECEGEECQGEPGWSRHGLPIDHHDNSCGGAVSAVFWATRC